MVHRIIHVFISVDRFHFKILNLFIQGSIKSLAIIVSGQTIASSATVDFAPVLVQVGFSIWSLPAVIGDNRSMIVYFESVVEFAVDVVVVIL